MKQKETDSKVKNKPTHQNGKGSKPRNISDQFKKNYDEINWSKNNERKNTRSSK